MSLKKPIAEICTGLFCFSPLLLRLQSIQFLSTTTLEFTVKKLICLLALVLSTNLWAAGGANGLGIVFGDPSGITFQHKLNERQFADFYFAYNWDDEVMFIGDYKFRLPGLFPSDVPVMPYVGIGAYLKVEDKKHHNDDLALGVRIPLGVEWKIPEAPITLFGELVPALQVIEKTDGDFQAGIGGRYFF